MIVKRKQLNLHGEVCMLPGICRLQVTGDFCVENLYGSGEMLRMLMKTVGFKESL